MRKIFLTLALLFLVGMTQADSSFIINPYISFPPATSSFDPDSISGLKLWLKADSLGLTDNVEVSTWADSSGEGKDVTGSSSQRPTFQTNEINGLPVVRFDGSDDILDFGSGAFDQSQPVTVFAVVNGTGMIVGQQYFWLSNNAVLNIYAAGGTVNGDATSGVFLVSAIYDGGSSEIWHDGASVGTGNPGPFGPGNFDPVLCIGSWGHIGIGFFNGDMAEILIYAGALSTLDRQAVENYLISKYAI